MIEKKTPLPHVTSRKRIDRQQPSLEMSGVTLSPEQIQTAAQHFHRIREEFTTIAHLPTECAPKTLDDAYAIQHAYAALMLHPDRQAKLHGKKEEHIGYKIGATNSKAQARLGVSAPFFGLLFASLTTSSPTKVSFSHYHRFVVEVEIGIRMGKDVPPFADADSKTPFDQDSIKEYIGDVLPCIEICDGRFANLAECPAMSVIANNAIHGSWVPGKGFSAGEGAKHWAELDLLTVPANIHVNGQQHTTGKGADALGNPLVALAWLANELPKFGFKLKKGDFISTGALGEVYLAKAGDAVVGDFGELGSVSLQVDA
jgi:2-keto-4-pentenoate hydratase